MLECHYATLAQGQLHYREVRAEQETLPALICLHPAPFSGLFFSNVMPLLAQDRRVIAPDYPGYGGSACFEEQPTIADYACHMLNLLQQLQLKEPVHLLGFHTGCLVAAEMALQAPDFIDAVVLVDVPYFTGEKQAEMLQLGAKPLELSRDESSIAGLWKSGVAAKVEAMGLDRAVQLLAEQLRAYPDTHRAFHAAFSYPCDVRFAQLALPVTVIASASMLHQASLDCAAVIPEATLWDSPQLSRGVFENGADIIAPMIQRALAEGRRKNSD